MNGRIERIQIHSHSLLFLRTKPVFYLFDEWLVCYLSLMKKVHQKCELILFGKLKLSFDKNSSFLLTIIWIYFLIHNISISFIFYENIIHWHSFSALHIIGALQHSQRPFTSTGPSLFLTEVQVGSWGLFCWTGIVRETSEKLIIILGEMFRWISFRYHNSGN